LPGGAPNLDLLVNDLSLHGQFTDLESFRVSIRRIMQIRVVAKRHLHALHCHRGLVTGLVTAQKRMPGALKALPLNEQRAIMSWLNQHGPFWDDNRLHDGGDWYECCKDVVTDTALGESAHCLLHGLDRRLVSFYPSNFAYDPIAVERVFDDARRVPIHVRNYWDPGVVETCLAAAPPSLASWGALKTLAVARFTMLRFARDAFDGLQGQPFKQAVAERILVLLDVLNQLTQSVDAAGVRTANGHTIYQQHFTGDKAWFSDSSESEKHDFKEDLTFPHPDTPSRTVFCSWHGKVKSPQYRIHFSWPFTAGGQAFVAFVGPKITKK
jgi:hypothetical protein